MNIIDGMVMKSAATTPSTTNDSRQPSESSTGRMSSGTMACPVRCPAARIAMARPRLRMNQFAMATDVPSPTPATDTVRATPYATQKCHGSLIAAIASSPTVTSSPVTLITPRAPYRSTIGPTTEASSAPPRLPTVNATVIVVRDHPSSSSMGLTNTEKTGPYIGTCAMEMKKLVKTIAQP